MTGELFYIPNLLSILRMALLLPVSYLLIYKFDTTNTAVVILLILMYLSDILDGFIARRFNMVSELGKVIDPLADKVSVIVIACILFFKGLIPPWFLVIVLLRDILILSFGSYLKKKKNVTLMSNMPGKIAVFSIGVILLLVIINYELFNDFVRYFYYIVLILILYSSYLYYIRFKKTIGENIHANQ